MIIFAILFGDGSDTKLTHFTFNLYTLISNSKQPIFNPINSKKDLYVEFKLLLYKYFFNHCNRQPLQHPILDPEKTFGWLCLVFLHQVCKGLCSSKFEGFVVICGIWVYSSLNSQTGIGIHLALKKMWWKRWSCPAWLDCSCWWEGKLEGGLCRSLYH